MNTPRLGRISRILSLVLTGLWLTGCSKVSEDTVDKVRVAPLTLSEWLRKDPNAYLLVDARPQAAFEAERIAGAERIDPVAVDPEDIDPRFEAYKAVIVYGQDPGFGRANVLTKRFLEADLDVYLLNGGLMAWKEQGLPVITGDTAEPTP